MPKVKAIFLTQEKPGSFSKKGETLSRTREGNGKTDSRGSRTCTSESITKTNSRDPAIQNP